MQTLDKSLKEITDVLPIPWANLGARITPQPGNLVVVAGAPGVGKSAFSLYWAVKSGVPSMVISLDTDLATQAQRTVALLTGQPLGVVRDDIETWQRFLAARVGTLPMVLDVPINASELEDAAGAFEEYYGCSPRFVVVDNLRDVIEGDGYEGHRNAFRTLKALARKLSCTVVVLHHLNRTSDGTEGYKALKLTDMQYDGEKDPEFVLGLWKIRDTTWGEAKEYLAVGILKNRFGTADPRGYDRILLDVDYERMKLDAYKFIPPSDRGVA